MLGGVGGVWQVAEKNHLVPLIQTIFLCLVLLRPVYGPLEQGIIRALGVGFLTVEQFLYLVKHRLYIAERAIDTGEANVSNLVHASQVVHD